jgi:hypothetical protein
VRPWLAGIGKWFGRARVLSRSAVPYEVACACGAVARGVREVRHQIVRCEACGRRVFVLPFSPLPPVAPLSAPPPSARPVASRPACRRWLLGVVLGLLVLAGIALGTGVALHFLQSERTPVAQSRAGEDRLHMRVALGQAALAEGNFQSAVEELDAAHRYWTARPDTLSASEGRQLTQLQRQAALLADLLTESLEEVLGRLSGLPEREGRSVFSRRYQGKAVVLYARVRRDAAGQYHGDYALSDGDRPARLELADLRLLAALPLEDGPLLLFGARLARVRREPAGTWVLGLEPDSGVLLTDRGAALACCFGAWDGEPLDEVLARQAAWLANLTR